jgi:hypothetical protein
MQFIATITAYDSLDHVTVAYTLRERPDNPEESTLTTLRGSTTVRGEGQQDPRVWLSDALLAALETL